MRPDKYDLWCGITWTPPNLTQQDLIRCKSVHKVQVQYYRVFHLTGPGQKVLSIKNGKILTKKVKVKVKTSHFSETPCTSLSLICHNTWTVVSQTKRGKGQPMEWSPRCKSHGIGKFDRSATSVFGYFSPLISLWRLLLERPQIRFFLLPNVVTEQKANCTASCQSNGQFICNLHI